MAITDNPNRLFATVPTKPAGSAVSMTDIVSFTYGGLATVTNNQLLVTVETLPTDGTLMVNGSAATVGVQFTWQDALSGNVVYTSTPTATSDTFGLRGQTTVTSRVTTPYVINLNEAFTLVTPGTTQAGHVFAGMLKGATQIPVPDFTNVYGASSSLSSTIPVPGVTTTLANAVIMVDVICGDTGSGAASPPATFPVSTTVSSISYRGLTFHRLGSQVLQVTGFGGSSQYFNSTVTHEVWWALAPTPGSATMTVTLSRSPAQALAGCTPYLNADPAAPWDTNASNLQNITSTALPFTGITMTPDAPDALVTPIVHQAVAGPDNSLIPFVNPEPPGDFGGFTGAISAASLYYVVCNFWARAQQPRVASLTLTPVPPPPTLTTCTDAELIFSPVPAFVDFSDEATRRRFVSDRSTPAYVGANGELAFNGTRPSVYLSILQGDTTASDFAQNKGVGGAFGVVS